MNELFIKEVDEGVIFGARVVPGSSKDDICGVLDGKLKIKIASQPEKGKANKSLVDFLARQLDISKSQISIISGQTSKNKQIRVLSITPEILLQRLVLRK